MSWPKCEGCKQFCPATFKILSKMLFESAPASSGPYWEPKRMQERERVKSQSVLLRSSTLNEHRPIQEI